MKGVDPAASPEGLENLSRRRSLKTALAVAVTLLSASVLPHRDGKEPLDKTTERALRIAKNLSGVDEGVLFGTALNPVEELPAWDRKVTEEQKQRLAAASVVLGSRQKSSSAPWRFMCSGVVVEISGRSYISTAAHCFPERDPFMIDKSDPSVPTGNVLKNSDNEYAIFQATTNSVPDMTSPVAFATGISATLTPNVDWALISFASIDTNFDQVLPLTFSDNPLQNNDWGQEVAVFGTTKVTGYRGIETTGTYLAPISLSNLVVTGQLLTVITLSARNRTEDPCTKGDSGRSFLMANNHLTGPQVWADAINYPDDPLRAEESDPVADDQSSFLQFESNLQTDLVGRFTTNCIMTSYNPGIVQSLVDGFAREL